MKGLKWLYVRQRDRETKRWTEDYYHWHCIGDRHSEPYFFNFSSRDCCPLAGFWIWPYLDWRLNLSDHMTLLSLYNILNAHTFSFRYPIHVIHFHCPLFKQVHILFRNPQLTCCLREGVSSLYRECCQCVLDIANRMQWNWRIEFYWWKNGFLS